MLPRVIRGDAFEVALTWPKASIDLIVTDPPYGKILKAKWDQLWQLADYIKLEGIIARLLVPGGTAYVWGGVGTPGHRPFFAWLAGLEARQPALRIYDLITWRKRRAYGKKDAYLFTREECVMLVAGAKPRTFNIPLLDEKRGYAGYNARYPAKSEYLRRTNVWTDVTEIFKGKIHDAEKPSRLAEIMIETSSRKGEHVVDLFAGSGSTGVAAMKLGRRCTLVEKSDCVMHDFKAVA
jgi:DNA modification methylase